jgi:membrane-associated PAP2 superfamily phosphatase
MGRSLPESYRNPGVSDERDGGRNSEGKASRDASPGGGQGFRVRPSWRREFLILGTVALASTAVFWLTDLDIRFSALFHDALNPEGPWPQARAPLWMALYAIDTHLTIALAIVAAALIVAGALSGGDRRRLVYGLFIILSVALGSGLIVNSILKEHWGHPRPAEIVEFGGDGSYAPPWAKRPSGQGKSFPSGHAAIAFSYIVFYFILRVPRPGLAKVCFWGSILFGSLMGLARVAQGRHFLSDVLWAAYIPYLSCMLFYYLVFRIPDRQSGD